MLSELYPPAVVAVANSEIPESPLCAQEEQAVEGAVPARRREFAVGRSCARAALEKLGLGRIGIPRAADRSPVWPSGVVGSISHCANYCAAVVAREEDVLALGLDVESLGRLGRDTRGLICGPTETSRLEQLGTAYDPVEIAFSAKESFYKAYYPSTRFFLDFLDVDLCLDPERGTFNAKLLRGSAPSFHGRREASGRFVVRDGRVFTGVAVES